MALMTHILHQSSSTNPRFKSWLLWLSCSLEVANMLLQLELMLVLL
jgi:hypothetical protein